MQSGTPCGRKKGISRQDQSLSHVVRTGTILQYVSMSLHMTLQAPRQNTTTVLICSKQPVLRLRLHLTALKMWRPLLKLALAQVSSISPGQSLGDLGLPDRALTVEHLVAVIRNLPASQAVIPAVAPGLKYMDSRAVAFLLKDIAKNGLPHRAVEIFDWLRKQPPSHELSRLCDVYTYTTGQPVYSSLSTADLLPANMSSSSASLKLQSCICG